MAPTEPRILPLTTDPFWLEARPRLVDDSWQFEWHRIDAPSHRLAMQVCTLDSMGWEEANQCPDAESKIGVVAGRCLKQAWCEGKLIPLGTVPHLQRRIVASHVYSLSTTGLDPFGAPPAASQP